MEKLNCFYTEEDKGDCM